MIFASETGIVDIPQHEVLRRGKLKPGEMLLVDLVENKLEEDAAIKKRVALEYPYQKWNEGLIIDSKELFKVREPESEDLVNMLFPETR